MNSGTLPAGFKLPSSQLSTACAACIAGPEFLSHSIVAALDAKDHEHSSLTHIAPNLRFTHDNIEATGREALFEVLADIPGEQRFHITRSTSQVCQATGQAKIWLSVEVRGCPSTGRGVRESVVLLHWRIVRGEWTCHLCRGLQHGGAGDD